MWFPSWLRNRKRHEFPRKRPTFRPRLEALEDRWLPSTLTVMNTMDSGAGSLRADIAAAHNGDTIKFAIPMTDPGYNAGTGAFTITLTSGELLIKKNLTIAGPGAGQLTISGNHTSRVFEVAKGELVALSGLTISNGFVVSAQARSGYDTTNGWGAGILNHGLLTVSNSTLSYNTASLDVRSGGSFDGGGINNDGTLTVSNSTLSYNSAGGGGGIYNERGGSLKVNDNSVLSYNSAIGGGGGGIGSEGLAAISGSQLLNNSGESGGGIANYATMTISDSTLSDNSARPILGDGGDGGGIFTTAYYTANTLTISGCSLCDNTATREGGGIYIGNGSVSVTMSATHSSVLAGNSAGLGGGIYIFYAALTVNGSILSSNTAEQGGGIYVNGNATYASTVTVENGSTIAGNLAPAGYSPDDLYNLGSLFVDGTIDTAVMVIDGNPAQPL